MLNEEKPGLIACRYTFTHRYIGGGGKFLSYRCYLGGGGENVVIQGLCSGGGGGRFLSRNYICHTEIAFRGCNFCHTGVICGGEFLLFCGKN